MLQPDIESFKSLSSEGNLIPVYKEILADTDTPVSAAFMASAKLSRVGSTKKMKGTASNKALQWTASFGRGR